MIQFQFYMSCFILLYKFISCIYINSTYTYNYHKLFCCVVAFCAIFIPLVFLMYYGCFYFYIFLCHYITYITISISYLAVFKPCKDLLNVNK